MEERQFTILFSFAFALNGVYGFVPAATAHFDASLAGFARGLFFRAAAPRCRPSQIRLASQPHADMDAVGAETMAIFMEIEALRRTQEKLEATIGAFRSEITAIRRAQVELEAQIVEKDEEIRILQAKTTGNADRLVLEQAKYRNSLLDIALVVCLYDITYLFVDYLAESESHRKRQGTAPTRDRATHHGVEKNATLG